MAIILELLVSWQGLPSPKYYPVKYICPFIFNKALLLGCFLLFGVCRFFIVTDYVSVQNDERHYSIDGLWVKAELPASVIFGDLLYNHIYPHPLYHPETKLLGYHGKIAKGSPAARGDLGPYPRAGHPGIFMLVLGAIYSLLPTSLLLQGDYYVHVARAVNICFDTAALYLLFDLIRRRFNYRIAGFLLFVLAGMPYIFVNGALAFLDSFGTFWAILSIWYYIVYMRNHQRFRNWVILGGIMAIAVLGKQSNIIIIPLFLCVTVLFPSRLPAKTLFLSMTCAVISGSITLCIFTNPFAFYKEISRETAPIMAAKQPGFSQEKPAETWIVRSFEKAIQNFTLPFRPKQNYHFGMVRHKGRPFVKNPIIVQAYEITTPSAAAIVCLCCILLVLRRKYAAWPLIACLLVFIAVVPLGNILRRLYILVPYATLIVAFGIAEISHIKTMGWRLRR